MYFSSHLVRCAFAVHMVGRCSACMGSTKTPTTVVSYASACLVAQHTGVLPCPQPVVMAASYYTVLLYSVCLASNAAFERLKSHVFLVGCWSI